jgi:hypothetical protein
MHILQTGVMVQRKGRDVLAEQGTHEDRTQGGAARDMTKLGVRV